MTDQDTTQVMPPADPPPEPQPEGTKRLLRSRSDRMLGGVAGGLGDYFRVDPVIFRIGFGVTLFFGGLGALIYLAMMIFVPSEPSDGTQASSAPRTFGRVLLLTLVAIAGLIGLAIMGVGAAWAAATGHGVLVAITVIAIGVALVVAAFNGGARWLILPALALAVPLGTVAAADIEFEGGIGKTTHTPQTVRAIPQDGYEFGIGDQRIDLRDLDWNKNSVIKVEADQGVGRMLVARPRGRLRRRPHRLALRHRRDRRRRVERVARLGLQRDAAARARRSPGRREDRGRERRRRRLRRPLRRQRRHRARRAPRPDGCRMRPRAREGRDAPADDPPR